MFWKFLLRVVLLTKIIVCNLIYRVDRPVLEKEHKNKVAAIVNPRTFCF
jgi:hypothetical protein